MIQVWVDGKGFVKKVDGFKELHKGDRFRTVDCEGGEGTSPIMIATSEPYHSFKNGKMIWVIKADFDLEGEIL